jgi:CheY-like chemotaxis protein
VEVQSTVNVGSRFTVILPVSELTGEVGEVGAPDESAAQSLPSNEFKGRARILVAEDNQENVGLLVDYLEAKGFDVLVARDGIEALDVARHHVPDLILMDLQMPRMDGLECARQLRAESRTRTIPVIALTALARKEDRQRCFEAGMNDYVSKPVTLSLLVEKIILHLGISAGEHSH